MRHKLQKLALYKSSILKTLTDKLLVYKAKNGDKEAFGKLYQKYLDSIYRYIFFRVNQDKKIAEDLTQAVFYKALEKLDSFDEEIAGFRPWIYKIAHNLVIDHYRNFRQTTTLNEMLADEDHKFEEKILQNMQVQNIYKAMNKELTEEQKQIIILKFVNDLSNKEIALILNKNEEAIRSLQYRALQNLRKTIKKHE
jgi:RNA polymerase sigma-70 factor, ECF subfamily